MWMAGVSRMPPGSWRCLEGSAHPWPVGTGVKDYCGSGQGCSHVPPTVPRKQILIHREHYQTNSQTAKKKAPNICFPKDYSLSLKKTLIFLTMAFTVQSSY